MNFSNLKKQSKDFGNLVKQVEKLSNPTFERDDTEDLYWKPTPDKTGNALAVIRFLPGPAVDGDDALPWCQYWDHGFQNKSTGKWYIEKSLTTLGQKDPVSEYNSTLWNASSDDQSWQRKQAREQKRRLHYVSNIQVISDPKAAANFALAVSQAEDSAASKSSLANTVSSQVVRHRTVAVRRVPFISATSPKKSPGLRVPTGFPLRRTSSVPLRTT